MPKILVCCFSNQEQLQFINVKNIKMKNLLLLLFIASAVFAYGQQPVPSANTSEKSHFKYFSYNYLTRNNPHIYYGYDHYPPSFDEAKLYVEEQNRELIEKMLNRIADAKGADFVAYFDDLGYPAWDRAAVFDNKSKGFKTVIVPVARLDADSLTGILYCKVSGELFDDAYFLPRHQIMEPIHRETPISSYPELFPILDLAAFELGMFDRQDIPLPYSIFPPWPEGSLTKNHYAHKVAVAFSPTDCYKLDSWSVEKDLGCCRYSCNGSWFIANKHIRPDFVTDPAMDAGKESYRSRPSALPIN